MSLNKTWRESLDDLVLLRRFVVTIHVAGVFVFTFTVAWCCGHSTHVRNVLCHCCFVHPITSIVLISAIPLFCARVPRDQLNIPPLLSLLHTDMVTPLTLI
jgi:hypothetical protein